MNPQTEEKWRQSSKYCEQPQEDFGDPVQLCSWVSLWLIVLCAEKRILPRTKCETHTQLMINNDKRMINENLSAYHV